MINCRLNIWINRKLVPQGKIYQQDGRWIYLADITENKWWRNYSGYSISAQILEAFTKAKIKPRIIYNLYKEGILYETNKSAFYKKGILVPWGSHRQYCLPIQNWKVCRDEICEPFNLPDLDVSKWLKPNMEPDNVSISSSVMLKLKADFDKKYPKYKII